MFSNNYLYNIHTQHTQWIEKSKSSQKLVSRSSRLIGSPKREYFPQKICDGDLADPNAGQWCGNSPLPYLHFLQGNVNSIFTSSSSLRTARFLILSNLQILHLEQSKLEFSYKHTTALQDTIRSKSIN